MSFITTENDEALVTESGLFLISNDAFDHPLLVYLKVVVQGSLGPVVTVAPYPSPIKASVVKIDPTVKVIDP